MKKVILFIAFFYFISFVNAQISLTMEYTNVSCFNGIDGSATAIPSGGVEPYTYLWSNGQTTQQAINLWSGYYSVTVSDASMQEEVALVSINEPSSIFATATVNPATCLEGGSISMASIGGAGSYAYSLDDQSYQTGDFFGGLYSDNYTVYVRDINDCLFTINNVFVELQDVIDCNLVLYHPTEGQSNGVITTNDVCGGDAPYTYSLDDVNYVTNNSFTGLSAGTYTLYINDANGGSFSEEVLLDPSLSSNSVDNNVSLKLYPNPANDYLHIELLGLSEQIESVQILTMDGKIMLSIANEEALNNEVVISINDFPKGVYIAQFYINNEWLNKRFVVMK